jgi:TetR/AcrR family transcriptional repressor of mexJK operon
MDREVLVAPPVHAARTPRKRQAVIAAARRVFAEKGYSASMEEVAFEAAVSKQTIYNQFGSKDQLFHAMIEDRLAELSAPLMRASPDADPREVLTELGRVYHTRIIAPENVKMTRMLLAAPNAAAVMRDFYNHGPTQFSRVFTDWLATQHRSGRLNVPDPALAAEHFLSFTYGGLYMKRLFGVDAPLDMADIERRLTYCVDAFLRAHAPG